jgi:hypothetical protein
MRKITSNILGNEFRCSDVPLRVVSSLTSRVSGLLLLGGQEFLPKLLLLLLMVLLLLLMMLLLLLLLLMLVKDVKLVFAGRPTVRARSRARRRNHHLTPVRVATSAVAVTSIVC